MSLGQTLLVRYINAGYPPQRIIFGGLNGQIVAADGRPLPSPVSVSEISSVAAERYDVIFAPTQSGAYTVEIEYLNWVDGSVLGVARTRIIVA